MNDEITPFGFRMGPMTVTRAARYQGYVVIFVETEYQRIEITATPKGRYLRVFGPYQRRDERTPDQIADDFDAMAPENFL